MVTTDVDADADVVRGGDDVKLSNLNLCPKLLIDRTVIYQLVSWTFDAPNTSASVTTRKYFLHFSRFPLPHPSQPSMASSLSNSRNRRMTHGCFFTKRRSTMHSRAICMRLT